MVIVLGASIYFSTPYEENEKYSYIEISILIGILLASRTVDFVVTGCSSGQGMMLACNSMPDVICGYAPTPNDAYMNKLKRIALKNYAIPDGEGIYTDMNAIRRDEDTDFIHSYYVDQWDWEKIISKEDRNEEYLKEVVRKIYSVFKATEDYKNLYINDINYLGPDDLNHL